MNRLILRAIPALAVLTAACAADAASPRLTCNTQVSNCRLNVCSREKFTDTYSNPSLVPAPFARYVPKMPCSVLETCPISASYFLPQYTGEGYTAWSKTVVADTNPGPKIYKWKNYLESKRSTYPPIFKEGGKVNIPND